MNSSCENSDVEDYDDEYDQGCFECWVGRGVGEGQGMVGVGELGVEVVGGVDGGGVVVVGGG